MGREFEAERVFSEEIDRLLAGKEVRTGAIADEDLRSALEFAQKMIDLRVSPSAQFTSRLKTGLLEKIEQKEKEKEARRGWFWRLMPSQPIFQVAAALVIVFIVGGVLWATLFRPNQQLVVQAPGKTPPAVTLSGANTPSPTFTHAPAASTTSAAAPTTAAPTTAPATAAPSATALPSGSNIYLGTSAATDKKAYLPGEPVNIQVTLKNITHQPVELQEFPPTLSLMQADTRQPVYTFNAGMLSRTLAPGEAVTYFQSWNQLDARGRHVSPGGYYLELEEVYRQGQSVRMDLTSPVYFNILPPASSGGETGRTIGGLNQPLTVNGITITLQQIEFSSAGITLEAFITPPPDYILKQDVSGLNPTIDYRTQARYAVNGNWFEKTDPAYVEYFAGGMQQTWFIPLTAGTETDELSLIIDNIGGWGGPWQFDISLK